MKYNHMFDIAFAISSTREDGSDVTPEQMGEAIIARVKLLLAEGEMLEAVSLVDTYEEQAI